MMNNYNPYMNNQFYMNELQSMREKIDSQLRNLQQQNQMQPLAQQPITQNFQIAPQQNANDLEAKYAQNIDEVKNTFVMKTGVFLNKDFSVLWIKDVTGNIRTFKTEEVFEMDEKDKEILMLKRQIKELEGVINYESDGNNSNNDESNEIKNTKKLSSRSKSNAK